MLLPVLMLKTFKIKRNAHIHLQEYADFHIFRGLSFPKSSGYGLVSTRTSKKESLIWPLYFTIKTYSFFTNRSVSIIKLLPDLT